MKCPMCTWNNIDPNCAVHGDLAQKNRSMVSNTPNMDAFTEKMLKHWKELNDEFEKRSGTTMLDYCNSKDNPPAATKRSMD